MTFRFVNENGQMKTGRTRKFFPSQGTCSFCQKEGHLMSFCPSLPTVPVTPIPFVENLATSPKYKLKMYEGLELWEVLRKVESIGHELNMGNPWVEDGRPFSSLRKRLGVWKAIGADRSVLTWIAYGYQMRFARKPRRMSFINAPNTRDHEKFVDEEIAKHVQDGSFVEVKIEDAEVINPFLISVNSSGKPRRCDDMRYVNAFLVSPVFKLETLERDVPNVVKPGHKMFTRDLEKAYYKIPIAEESTKYQCFFWKGRCFKSRVLLFGFCQAPFVFTKICRVIVRFGGALLIGIVNFVDDFLFSEEPGKLKVLELFVDSIFTLLGWTFSLKDNQMGERVKFLGFIVDSTQRKYFIPDTVCVKVRQLINVTCQAFHENRKVTIKDVQRVTGKLTSLKLAIPSIPVWIRELLFCIPSNEEDQDRLINLTGSSVDGLRVCQILVDSNSGSPFMAPMVERDVFVDSSEIGWGACTIGFETYGNFESEVIGQSSTFRELQGFIHMLEDPVFTLQLKGRAVRFNMDSRSAIANLIHSGPVKTLSPLVQKAWVLIHNLNIDPTFNWVSRETRSLAHVDELSKRTTFSMRPESLEMFSRGLNRPVLTFNHNRMSEVIGLIVVQKVKCALLAPRWEAKSWWPDLKRTSRELITVSHEHIIFNGTQQFPRWEFVLAVFE